MTDIPIPRINKERKQRLKDLMRHRTTLDQGLTLRQIFNELYPDIVEQYHDKPSGIEGMSELELTFRLERNRIVQLIKRLSESDDEFRWLSPVGYRNEKGKIKEYRYVNLKPGNNTSSEGYRLLDEVHDRKEKYWNTYERRTQQVLENSLRSEEERNQLAEIELAKRRLRKLKKEEREQKKRNNNKKKKTKNKGFGITEPTSIEFLGRIHSTAGDSDERMIY